MSPCGLRIRIFLPRKRSYCWPLPRLSGVVSSTLFRIVSPTPGTGARCPSPSLQVLWRRRRTPPPLLLGFRDLLYRPCQTRARITMGDCFVLCGRSGVAWTALLHIARDVSGCSSPRDVSRRRSPRTRPPSGSGRRYLGHTSSREVRSGPSSESQGDLWYHSVASFQEELRCRPGVEGGYMVQAHHLHVSLPKGP